MTWGFEVTAKTSRVIMLEQNDFKRALLKLEKESIAYLLLPTSPQMGLKERRASNAFKNDRDPQNTEQRRELCLNCVCAA